MSSLLTTSPFTTATMSVFGPAGCAGAVRPGTPCPVAASRGAGPAAQARGGVPDGPSVNAAANRRAPAATPGAERVCFTCMSASPSNG
jgi:hypothetical protein